MKVDASEVMTAVFVRCRHVPAGHDPGLAALRPVIARVRELGSFALDGDEPCLAAPALRAHPVTRTPPPDATLTDHNRALFDVIDHGAAELERLCAAGAIVAVRDLAYAFHALPDLLAVPAGFDRDDYISSLRLVAYHRELLSADLMAAVAALLRVTPKRLATYMSQDGFARSMWADRLAPST